MSVFDLTQKFQNPVEMDVSNPVALFGKIGFESTAFVSRCSFWLHSVMPLAEVTAPS
jgi:hypothetical protein